MRKSKGLTSLRNHFFSLLIISSIYPSSYNFHLQFGFFFCHGARNLSPAPQFSVPSWAAAWASRHSTYKSCSRHLAANSSLVADSNCCSVSLILFLRGCLGDRGLLLPGWPVPVVADPGSGLAFAGPAENTVDVSGASCDSPVLLVDEFSPIGTAAPLRVDGTPTGLSIVFLPLLPDIRGLRTPGDGGPPVHFDSVLTSAIAAGFLSADSLSTDLSLRAQRADTVAAVSPPPLGIPRVALVSPGRAAN